MKRRSFNNGRKKAKIRRDYYLSMFEGVSILSALSKVTHSIGLTATIATSYADPFTVARQIASLDKISKGRAG
ncbi:LLM class flavin-dependent oxidoreductase [Paenibacillus kribbensis]|uniref:LLM class flavin-dependent oxidoreductase n=1 Tax=Paenibacillus kribbensis TaxID=172713 RepID=UPI002DB94484|nr:LLM class flavin-dependent oxidoreductase [Paenibacillus kribbensis]MEC0237547.1 LLM class flavin-dependent oxidoreductase [Paenibacillus kribbensis]